MTALFRAKYKATRTNPQPDLVHTFSLTTSVDLKWDDGRTYRWDGTNYVVEDEDGTKHTLKFRDGECTYVLIHQPPWPPPPAPRPPATSESGPFIQTGPLDPEPE